MDTYSLETTEKEVDHNASGVVIKTWIGLPVKSNLDVFGITLPVVIYVVIENTQQSFFHFT